MYSYNLILGIDNCIGNIETNIPLQKDDFLDTPSGKYKVHSIHHITTGEKEPPAFNNPQEYHKVVKAQAHIEKLS